MIAPLHTARKSMSLRALQIGNPVNPK